MRVSLVASAPDLCESPPSEIVVFVFLIPENEQINRYRLCYYAPPSPGQFVTGESLSCLPRTPAAPPHPAHLESEQGQR